VRALVAQAQPESLALEYKSTYASGLVKTVAAMANSYGGLILLGVADSTASAWHKENGSDRGSYVASRLRQQQPHGPE
jgi:predicted HTH transcriptional regulator